MNAINTPALGGLAKAIVADFGRHDAADLDAARVIGTEVALKYGDDDAAGFARIRDHGIWNDHPAVQAALAAIRICRRALSDQPPAAVPAALLARYADAPDLTPLDVTAAVALAHRAPLPWRADAGWPGDVLDAAGNTVATVDFWRGGPDARATTLAALIARAVNTAGGFPGDHQ